MDVWNVFGFQQDSYKLDKEELKMIEENKNRKIEIHKLTQGAQRKRVPSLVHRSKKCP